MERTRVLKPGSSLTDPQGPSFYDIKDLYVGGKIEVLSHSFVLLDADEYVFNFMENEPSRFKFSDIKTCVNKIFNLLKSTDPSETENLVHALRRADSSGSGTVDRHTLVSIAKAYFPSLTDHVFHFNIRRL